MPEIVANYWWVALFTVPALAFLLKHAAERAALVDVLPASLRRKLAGLEHSYPGHWVVTATLRDGRRFSRVVIDERFRLVSASPAPFRLAEVADVAWEGAIAAPAGPLVKLSE